MLATVYKYLNQITPLYKEQPKFVATMTTKLQPFVDIQNALAHLIIDFDLDTAIGLQLDKVGERINLSRTIIAPVPNPWFSWDDDIRGWDMGRWFEDFSSGNFYTSLDDDSYRALLRARIAANSWDGLVASATKILKNFFTISSPNSLILGDDKNCLTVIYGLAGFVPDDVLLEIFSGPYLPLSAAGIRTVFVVSSVQNTPLFGYDVQNNYIKGWDDGSWGLDLRDKFRASIPILAGDVFSPLAGGGISQAGGGSFSPP